MIQHPGDWFVKTAEEAIKFAVETKAWASTWHGLTCIPTDCADSGISWHDSSRLSWFFDTCSNTGIWQFRIIHLDKTASLFISIWSPINTEILDFFGNINSLLLDPLFLSVLSARNILRPEPSQRIAQQKTLQAVWNSAMVEDPISVANCEMVWGRECYTCSGWAWSMVRERSSQHYNQCCIDRTGYVYNP